MSTPAGHPSPFSDADDLAAIKVEQFCELMDALALDSDLDFAYQLQLEEALAASLASQPPASSSSSSASIPPPDLLDSTLDAYSAAQDFSKSDQIFQDWLQCQFELRRTVELHRRVHDRGFLREILNVPDDDWSDCGEAFQKPFGEGSSKNVENRGVSKLYFKGLVSDEGTRDGSGNGNGRRVLVGIGVAICDPEGRLVFEMSKPLIGNERSRNVAEIKALIEGLNAAMGLKLKRLRFYCDYYPLYQFVTGKWPPKQRKIAALLSEVTHLQVCFESCIPRLVARHDVRFAFKLARDAIVNEIIRTEGPAPKKKLTEACVICLEDCDVNRMFAVDGCLHRYCFSCMKQHVEVKLLQGLVPKCPHDGCKFDLNVDSCAKFLTPKDMATMRQRIKEASIPVTEKVYCPYPKCSALMTKGEVLEYTVDVLGGYSPSGVRKCMKCHGLFCINCKVPWHNGVSCNVYQKSNNPASIDLKLKSLASTNLWRQCVKCNHMIELAEGCYHMTCRCGHEFCYKCGATWKGKLATCSCPLWSEDRIWYNDNNRDFGNDMFTDDEEDELYESDGEYYYI